MPLPGRLIARLSSISVAPISISQATTKLLRAISLLLISLGRGPLIPSPNAISISRILYTIAASTSGSSNALWSGPSILRSKVKSFSMRNAPLATAATGIVIP